VEPCGRGYKILAFFNSLKPPDREGHCRENGHGWEKSANNQQFSSKTAKLTEV
jgi:hypothetical protein